MVRQKVADGSHLRGDPSPSRHGDATAVVGESHRPHDALLVRALLVRQLVGRTAAQRAGVAPARREAWYAKQRATFSDTIAFVRRWLWSQQHFQLSNAGSDVIKVPRALFERLTETLCYAA